MAWVGVFHDKPQEITGVKPEGDVSENFTWIEVEDIFTPYVNQDYIVDKSKNTVVPPSKEYFINQLKADLAAIRYNAQNYFIEYDEHKFLTNTTTSNTITAKILDAQLSENPDTFSVNYKSYTGYINLNFSKLKEIKQLITNHIQLCFDREGEITAVLDNMAKKEKSYSKILETFLKEVALGWPLPEKQEGHY